MTAQQKTSESAENKKPGAATPGDSATTDAAENSAAPKMSSSGVLTGNALAERAIALRLACPNARALCQRLIADGADEVEAGQAAAFYDPQRPKTRQTPAEIQHIDLAEVHPLARNSVAIISQIVELDDCDAVKGAFARLHLGMVAQWDPDYSWPAIRVAVVALAEAKS